MFAVISDIHSNLAALTAVLADIEQRGATRIVCLGDVVGYGPNPRECLDLIREKCRVCIAGNHDHAVLYEPTNFNTAAERAAYWTRQVLESEPDVEKRNARWEFLGGLPVRATENGVVFVHASPRRPVNEYIFPEDVFTNPQKVIANFERLDARLCFIGHTHQPGVFLDDPYFDPPHELPDSPFFELDDERAIVNVGSVGQPRDRDPRASYVLVHPHADRESDAPGTGSLVKQAMQCSVDQIEFVRVEYDIETTVKQILAEPALDDMLGNRLYEGR
jgi:diadenosine tetraphosphatase ApaH/serine/threonine PP2A family protein phosphatase